LFQRVKQGINEVTGIVCVIVETRAQQWESIFDRERRRVVDVLKETPQLRK
jgi:hypothetical protein